MVVTARRIDGIEDDYSGRGRDKKLPKLLSGEFCVGDAEKSHRGENMNELKTCFRKVDYDLTSLLEYIKIGDIGLPDIQRPFVWTNAKVRDLFDSMYRGFPVGYLLFWENGNGNGVKQIGLEGKQHPVPSRLIVDGQQRLTSLFAVFRGKKVVDEDYKERQIEVAFRPCDGKFEVADAAIRKDPEWIPNISTIWASGKPSYEMVHNFLEQVGAKGSLTQEEKTHIARNLDRLFDLRQYPFTALEIASTVEEEQVADIFVRINSLGVRLNQADFILTLMSVFWDEGCAARELFCRLSRKRPTREGPLRRSTTSSSQTQTSSCAWPWASDSIADASRACTKFSVGRTWTQGSFPANDGTHSLRCSRMHRPTY